MSGNDHCKIKLGNKEMEAHQVKDFCRAILEMKDSKGAYKSKGLRLYIRAGKAVEAAIRAGMSEEQARGEALRLLQSSNVGLDEKDVAEATKQINLYVSRRKVGNNKALSSGMSGGPGSDLPLDSNEFRKFQTLDKMVKGGQQLTGTDAQEYESLKTRSENGILTPAEMDQAKARAQRNREEVLGVQMRIPKEIFKEDYAKGTGAIASQDYIVITVGKVDRNGNPVIVKEKDSNGNIVEKRETGVRGSSYDRHVGSQSHDSEKVFDQHVMGGVQAQMIKSAMTEEVEDFDVVAGEITSNYKEAAKNMGGRILGAKVIENKIISDVEVGVDENGYNVGLQAGVVGHRIRFKGQGKVR